MWKIVAPPMFVLWYAKHICIHHNLVCRVLFVPFLAHLWLVQKHRYCTYTAFASYRPIQLHFHFYRWPFSYWVDQLDYNFLSQSSFCIVLTIFSSHDPLVLYLLFQPFSSNAHLMKGNFFSGKWWNLVCDDGENTSLAWNGLLWEWGFFGNWKVW